MDAISWRREMIGIDGGQVYTRALPYGSEMNTLKVVPGLGATGPSVLEAFGRRGVRWREGGIGTAGRCAEPAAGAGPVLWEPAPAVSASQARAAFLPPRPL